MNQNLIVWQPVPAIAMRFAIESDAPRALQNARRLFAPWIIEDSDAAGEIARRWRIEERDDDRWSLASDNSSHVAGTVTFNEGEHSIIELLAQIEYASIAHLVAHLPSDFVGLHGALLSREWDGKRRAVIVVGPKEAGKSTLACALWRAGWTLHCDDFTLLDARGHAWPTARRVSLRHGSRELLGEELWQSAAQTPSARPSDNGVLFHPHEIEGQHAALTEPLPIGAICFLKRRDIETAPAQSAPLGAIEAAFALLPYSNLLLEAGSMQFSCDLADWGAQLSQITMRVADIPVYDLGRGRPAAMIREIERLIAA